MNQYGQACGRRVGGDGQSAQIRIRDADRNQSGDIVSGNDLDLADRNALFERHAERFGRSWIVLPNPQYGSWELASFGGDFERTDDERRAAKRALLRSN